MSIIQEALKKAQSNVRPVVQRIAKAPAADRRVPIAVISLILAAFAVFSAGIFLSKAGKRVDRTSAANSQEVSYKPLVRDQAIGSDAAGGQAQISAPPEVSKTPESPELVLSGIMYLEEGPKAIINNFIVGLGDSVLGAKITVINRQNVILEYENVEITLGLK